jgi:hypothetical protein
MKKTFFVLGLSGFVACALASNAFGAVVTPTHMFGPLNPARVDTNGLMTADPQGGSAVPMRTGTALTLSHPWSDIPATGNLCSFNALTGKYNGICRTTTGGLTQSITVTGFSGSGYPTSFAFTESGNRSPKNGTGRLVDQNGDGIWDGIALTGGSTNLTLPFVYVDTNGDGFADYVSIPWSAATLVGLNPNGSVFAPGAGGPNPQVWIPLADTNGDGKGDAIVMDLTGSGSPDPDLFSSPAMGPVVAPPTLAPPIPTFSEWSILGLALALTGAALWQIRAHVI